MLSGWLPCVRRKPQSYLSLPLAMISPPTPRCPTTLLMKWTQSHIHLLIAMAATFFLIQRQTPTRART